MTSEKRKGFNWYLIIFMASVIFEAGVFFASAQNMKSQAYSHEDGKVLEAKVDALTEQVKSLNAEFQIFLSQQNPPVPATPR